MRELFEKLLQLAVQKIDKCIKNNKAPSKKIT